MTPLDALKLQIGVQMERALEGASPLGIPLERSGKQLWHQILSHLTGQRLLQIQHAWTLAPAALSQADAPLLQAWRIQAFRHAWNQMGALREALLSVDVLPLVRSVGEQGIVRPETLGVVFGDRGKILPSPQQAIRSRMQGALCILAQLDVTCGMYAQGEYAVLFPWAEQPDRDAVAHLRRQGEREWCTIWGTCRTWELLNAWMPLDAWVAETCPLEGR